MRKQEFINIVTVGFTSLLMIWLTRWDAYQDAMKNWLFIILMVFAMTTIFGYFLPRLLMGREIDSYGNSIDDFDEKKGK